SYEPPTVVGPDDHRGAVGQGRIVGGGVERRGDGTLRAGRAWHQRERQASQPGGEDLVVARASRVLDVGEQALPDGVEHVLSLLNLLLGRGEDDHEIVRRDDHAVLAEGAVTVKPVA